MAIAIFTIYGLLLTFILAYSLIQLAMLLGYWRNKTDAEESNHFNQDSAPLVTLQLPIFNEKYVAKRLIEKVNQLKYPKGRLEIQILDDSIDETCEIIENYLNSMEFKHENIYIKRDQRNGFKAGALAYGLEKAKGEFIAILDADFMPNEDFLLKIIPHFQSPEIGMVQSRWGHLNKNYSMLTKLQAFGLDAHFSIEQVGRNQAGHFINFNGTAGIWRKECINQAGGWSSDTLTEDLDLSYRAQLKGWKFKYLEEVETQAELPINIYPLKSQQFRWTKGAAECFRKNIKKVLKSPLSFKTKLHAFFHLSNSFLFIAILFTAILSFPLLVIKTQTDAYNTYYQIGSIFVISLLILVLVYFTSHKARGGKTSSFGYYFPLFLSISMGLSLHNTIAVIEGYLGIKSPFVRTPKFNSIDKTVDNQGLNNYVKTSITSLWYFETLLFLYFTCASIYGIINLELGLLAFHLLLSIGFGYISLSALKYHLIGFKTT